jgi:hypothetical protein
VVALLVLQECFDGVELNFASAANVNIDVFFIFFALVIVITASNLDMAFEGIDVTQVLRVQRKFGALLEKRRR